MVHTLDRLGRAVRDTRNLIHELAERGVGGRNLADPIRVDSSNPADPMAQLPLEQSAVRADHVAGLRAQGQRSAQVKGS